MNSLDDLRVLLNRFFNMEEPRGKKMKRVFQWRRYLEWKNLTHQEKISAKRFLLLPVFAYLILGIFNQNILLMVLLLIGYVLYRKFEKVNIIKK
tara:strand:+ start:276 stop:557 length:282 start_codon:yes stop_codon:yes gene_type:complete